MANAGRVAIVPKGEFEFGTPYKRLDLVRYEKNVYVAKRENISIFPTDESYWMLVMQLSEFQPDGTTILSDEHGNLSVVTGKPNGVAGLDENGKIPMEQIPEWDTKDNITTFTSNDSLTPTAWDNVDLLESGEKHSSILEKISTMFKNVRYIYKLLGTTDISAIGNGTITGAIHSLNTDIRYKYIGNEITLLENIYLYAYVENGMVIIRSIVPTSLSVGLRELMRVPEKYAPREVFFGYVSYNSSSSDINKASSVLITREGSVKVWLLSELTHDEPFTIMYPLKRS